MWLASGYHIGQCSLVVTPASGVGEKVEFQGLRSSLKQVRPPLYPQLRLPFLWANCVSLHLSWHQLYDRS